jgi:DNA-binding response OmpR family regulator
VYEFSPFRLDTANQCLLRTDPSEKEVRIQLPPKAFSILQYLVDNADRLVSHNELMDKVWPDTINVGFLVSSPSAALISRIWLARTSGWTNGLRPPVM